MMASQRSELVLKDKVPTNNSFCRGRWVKNVLLTDIKNLLPPHYILNKNLTNKSDINAEYSVVSCKASRRGSPTLKTSDYVEGYVTNAKSCQCFVDGCDFTARSFSHLLLHVLRSHSSVNRFNCLHCSHVCSLSRMVEHLAMHGPTIFECNYCTYHHFSLLKLREHIRMKHIGSKIVIRKLRDLKEKEKQKIYNIQSVKNDDLEIVNGENGKEELEDMFVDLTEDSSCLEDEPDNINVIDSNDSDNHSERMEGISENFSKELDNNYRYLERSALQDEIQRVKNMPDSMRNVIIKTEALYDDSENENLESRININSAAVNYRSTELEQRKTEMKKNWQCGLCDYVCLSNNMIAHAKSAHEIKYQFKCTICSIFIPSRGYVDSHCSVFHPSTIVTLIAYYYLPGSNLPYKRVKVTLPDGQVIFSPDNPIFVHKTPDLLLTHFPENINDISYDEVSEDIL